MSTEFDAIIIGAGQAGPSLAGRLTAAGRRVALIERKLFGGTCVNTGCKPTKTLVASAHAAHIARRAAEFGVGLSGAVTIDMKTVKARKDAISTQSREEIEAWLGGMAGCTVFRGQARFEAAGVVRVGEERLSAPQVFINVGGRAVTTGFPGFDQVTCLTNSTILELEEVPRHLVVVGGSYIGLEFAQMYRRFGAEVTIVERGPRLIQREDEDISAAIKQILQDEGIRIRLDACCIGFRPEGADIAVSVDCQADAAPSIGSHVLLAVGRQPNTDDLGLDAAGVQVDARGYIRVDDELRTNIPGIWAMGDCNGRGAFTHTAYNDFEIIAANLLDGDKRRVSDRITAYGLYIDPPLGRVGQTEAEVRRSGRPALVGTRPMTKVGRAVEKAETKGFMKVIVDAQSKAILGAAILGVGGDEVVHSLLDTMYAGAPATVVQRAVHIHPTVSELVPTLLSELRPLA